MNYRMQKGRRFTPWRLANVAVGLLALCVIGYTARVKAQDEAQVYDSSSAVAKEFLTQLTMMSERSSGNFDRTYYGYLARENDDILSTISVESSQRLRNGSVATVLSKMVEAMAQPVWEVASTTATGAQSATVKLMPNLSSTREVVCVHEVAGWRVDLVATYAKWFNLSEQQLNVFLGREIEVNKRAACQSNMKQIALGLMQYIQDYDEKFPPAKQWKDVIMPYVKSEQIFRCPSTEQNKDGYALNWKLSMKANVTLEYPASMVMLYESTALQPNHSGEGEDMAFRHLGGTNIGFADGHIHWVKENPERKWPDVHFTFKPDSTVKPRR